MGNETIVLIIFTALGFAFIINKLNKVIDVCSLLVSMQIGKLMVHEDDGEGTILFSVEDEEED